MTNKKRSGKDNRPYKYNLIQEGMVVASVEAADKETALKEINHYAIMYGQDGPVKIEESRRRRKKK